MDPAERRVFVLVHGAWCGGWIWRRVSDRLLARGHRVYTPTLTGLGERSHLLNSEISLSTHIQDVTNLILWEELHGIVLVGHSYGGMVISGIAETVPPGTIAAVVFLDAALPEDGKALVDYAPLPPTGDSAYLVPPIPAAPPRFNPADIDWVNRLRTPQPLGTFTETIKLGGAIDRVPDKAFVLATGYDHGSLAQFAERARTTPGWRYFELNCGHDVMLSMPDETTAILEGCIGK